MANKKTDITIKFEGKTFKRTLDSISKSLESELKQGIKNLAYAAHSKIIATAQNTLKNTRQDYLKGLKIKPLGSDSYIIYLEGNWANKIESGFAGYDQRETLLKSQKTVQVGSRAGQKWVQESKEGNKFAHVPFQHQPFAKNNASDLDSMIKSMQGHGRNGVVQNITKIFKDISGSPLEGKVAVGKSENKFLDGLVKYQKKYVSKTGKETIQSVYTTYRTISEVGSTFMHPGYKGLKGFKIAEKWLEKEIDNLIKNLGK